MVAQVYDRAEIAARDENPAKLREAVAELRKLGAVSEALMFSTRLAQTPAEKEVEQGARLDMQAMVLSGSAKDALLNRAAGHYRKALQLDPDFTSEDPVRLNYLGYFLADRGSSPADFKMAETLTRKSLLLMDELIELGKSRNGEIKPLLSHRAAVRDSVAWALYRQGRYAEALKVQQQAIQEAKEAGEAESDEMAEHLRLITEALKKKDVASKSDRAPSPASSTP